MNDQQLLMVAVGPLATLIVVMFGVFLNGRQLDGVRNELRAEMRAVESKIGAVDVKLDSRFGILEERTKHILDKIKELYSRLTRMEDRRG